MSKLIRQLGMLVFALFFAFSPMLSASAGTPVPGSKGAAGISNTGADTPVTLKLPKSFLGKGVNPNEKVDIIIQMRGDPVSTLYKQTLTSQGPAAANQDAYLIARTNQLKQAQVPVVAAASRVGRVTGQLTALYNGVAVTGVARRDLAALYNLPGVVDVHIMGTYQLNYDNNIQWVGAERVREQLGLDGRNTTIAIIDTGIDYTHRNFGGPGTVDAYEYASTILTAPVVYSGTQIFPTQKVPMGYDFVGSAWVPGQPLDPDPNPIDDSALYGEVGHGSHVAGIAGGFGVPNTSVNGSIPLDFDGTTIYHGMAPAAQLYAYKVCSSQSNACSGEAMVLAMERSADPNQNGSTLDHVDAMNMSIGSSFAGDPVTAQAANAAVDAGIAVAMSAGNDANTPFITGSPATADKVLSVASSVSPGNFAYNLVINSPVTLTQALMPFVVQSWGGPITPSVTADLIEARTVVTPGVRTAQLGCTQPGNENPFPPGSLSGKIAIIDRGTCAVSQKAYNAEHAGAVGMILVMLPGQTPSSFAWGGEVVTIPTVSMAYSDMAPTRAYLAAGGTVNATLGMNSPIDLTDTLSGFTSRGPSALGALKPDIAAPGDNIFSTAAGTGDQGEFLSGTSMASPHVAGALAQMKQYHPTWSAIDLEAVLVNSAVPTLTIVLDPATRGIAPISLAGSGRLAVDRAAQLMTTVTGDSVASINFGTLALTDMYTATRPVHISNHADQTKNYDLSAVSQFTQSAALQIAVSPSTMTLEPGASGTATVTIHIDPSLLPDWNLYGSGMASQANLTAAEMAGWVVVHDTTADQTARAPWYVLPRKASNMRSAEDSVAIGQGVTTETLTLNNTAAFTGTAQIYNLMGEDPMESLTQTAFMPTDVRSVGVRSMPVSVSGTMTDVVDFGISTYGLRTIPVNSEFDVFVDTNQDGTPDFDIFNYDLGYLTGAPSPTGQNVVVVFDIAHNDLSLSGFYAQTGIATTNISLMVPMAQLGMTAGQAFDFYVQATDLGYGVLTDVVPDTGKFTFDTGHMRFTPDAYTVTAVQGTPTTVSVRSDTSATDSEKGLLLLYQFNVPTWSESQAIYMGPFHFSDVSTSDWFYNYVLYMNLRGIVSGYSDGTFRPYATATRGQIAKMVVLGMNLPIVTPSSPTFTDVPVDSPFYAYIETAAHFGLVSGYSDHTFRPGNDVTRGQIAKIVIGADVLTAGWTLLNPATPTFSDVPRDNPFYTYIETAAAHGIISGYADGTFRWGNNTTRAQVSKMIDLAATSR